MNRFLIIIRQEESGIEIRLERNFTVIINIGI